MCSSTLTGVPDSLREAWRWEYIGHNMPPPRGMVWLVGDFNRHDILQKDLEIMLAEHDLGLAHPENLITYRQGEVESALDRIFINDKGFDHGTTTADVCCSHDLRTSYAHSRLLLRWKPVTLTNSSETAISGQSLPPGPATVTMKVHSAMPPMTAPTKVR